MPTLDRRRFLATAAAAAAGLGARAAVRRPNIIIIYADDQGYGDLSCYGSTTIASPNIDRLAAEGAKLTDFYSCCPVCSASRYGLLTGRYQVRSGFADVLFPYSENGLRDDEVTIAEALRRAGYATGIVGKWHQGHQPQYLPLRHGFDSFFGLPYSNDMMGGRTPKGRDPYPPLPLYSNDRVVETDPDQRWLTRRYADAAKSFIRQHRAEPFFLYLPHAMPHLPLHVSPYFAGTSQGGLYGDVIQELDWAVGQVLELLDELGLVEDTFVLYSSDNGPRTGSAGPLRGMKGTTWEGGVREPCLVRFPGRIRPGTVVSEPAMTIDLLPTCCRLAGAPLPDRVLDGVDLTGLLCEGRPPDRGRPLFDHHGGKLKAVREGRWKLHLLKPDNNQKVRFDGPELYDLMTDLGETTNLAAQHPEVVAQLRAAAEMFTASVVPGQ